MVLHDCYKTRQILYYMIVTTLYVVFKVLITVYQRFKKILSQHFKIIFYRYKAELYKQLSAEDRIVHAVYEQLEIFRT